MGESLGKETVAIMPVSFYFVVFYKSNGCFKKIKRIFDIIREYTILSERSVTKEEIE